MEDQPYQPPKSNVEIVDDKPGSSIKAVVAGLILNTVLTIAVSIVLGVIFGVYLASQGYTPDEIQEYVDSDLFSNAYSYLAMIVGLLVTTLSAYVVAVIAKQNVFRNASLMVVIMYLIVIAFQWGDMSQFSRIILMLSADLAFAWAGAWLYLRSRAR